VDDAARIGHPAIRRGRGFSVTEAEPCSRTLRVDPALSASSRQAPAFRALFEREFAYVFHTLFRLGVRRPDLEDMTHEVFVAVHHVLADYDPTRPLRPWLFGIAFRVASDYRRRAHHRREAPEDRGGEAVDERPPADELLAAEQARRLLIEALDEVELERRAVLVLHDLEGHSVPEIAHALAIPLNTAYSRLRLAREQLRAAVKRLRLRRGEG
jgi:RNA polymerase sigma-70 factor (ECF subfamily)